jgi:phage-related protein
VREIRFYKTRSGRSPIQEFLRTLSGPQMKKIFWVFHMVEERPVVDPKYFKKLVDTEGLWEVRVQYGGDEFRLLGFFDGAQLVVLVSAFAKKTEKTPPLEIRLAENRKREYLNRKQEEGS